MYYQNDRGFFGPFILGGLTGGLLAPYFYNNKYSQPYPYQYSQIYYYPIRY